MAEDFLDKIYRVADSYTSINNLISKYRNGSYDSNFAQEINSYIRQFETLSKELIQNENPIGGILWNGLIELARNNNLMICLDLLEIMVLPVVLDYLKNLPRIDVDDEDGIILKSSELGFIYQTKSDTMYRCESAYNPMQEAYCIVKDYYKLEEYEYILLGGGLGYIPYQLFLQSDGDIHMTVYYHDQKSYEYARLYGVLDWIPNECIDIIVTDDILEFLNDVRSKKCRFYIYRPDMSKYPNKEIEAINMAVINQNTMFTTGKYIRQNYYRNIRNVDKYIDDFDKKSITDRFLIVAGGPSVDDNLDFIKTSHNRGFTIISVGTVFKKLLNLGICPDIVTALDPFVTCSKQFEGIDDNGGVALFIGFGADYRIARLYTGPKYLVPIEGIIKEISEDVKRHISHILPGCITVTSLSYCVAEYLGAKEIYLVGADFGYPGGVTHAIGTNDRAEVSGDDHYKILSNDGKMIYANAQMIMYREEMEKLIEKNSHIKTTNMSKHGALIKGTFLYSDEDR